MGWEQRTNKRADGASLDWVWVVWPWVEESGDFEGTLGRGRAGWVPPEIYRRIFMPQPTIII